METAESKANVSKFYEIRSKFKDFLVNFGFGLLELGAFMNKEIYQNVDNPIGSQIEENNVTTLLKKID